MLKNEMPFLFIEDTVVDDELITNLQNEVDYEDNFEKKAIPDNDETTKLQEPEDFSDDFTAKYASDADADTDLTKEVDYNDNQKTPVNIDEFSNEAADMLFEMGDILGALELMESETCDGTNLEVDCPDEGEVIPQADEADVCDTEASKGELVEPVSEEEEADVEADDSVEEDFSSLEEEFLALFEDADSDDDESEDDKKDSDDDESEDDKKDSDDDESEDNDEESEDNDEDECEDCKKGKCEKHNVSESFSILDWFE